jgi:hypothetical protein
MSSAASPSAVTSVIHRALTERHAVWRTVSAPGAGPLRTLANDELAGVAEAPDPGSHLLAVAVDPVRQEVACWRGTLARVDVPWAYFVAGPQGTTPDFTDV